MIRKWNEKTRASSNNECNTNIYDMLKRCEVCKIAYGFMFMIGSYRYHFMSRL